jgi:HD-GYP domain-containing protein (c-di-GMP phosphodiesterase class II)
VAQQVERMTQLARLEIAPLLARIDDQRRLAETQVATAADAAEATLARRADELKHVAERMLELCERQLAERIASIRPRPRAALEQVEQSAQQRVTAAMDEMARALERSERQVVERIEALRPRAAEVVFQLETDLNEQLKRMEDDAVANVHWMEHRLSRRIDELAERLSRVLVGELETAHAATRTGDTTAGLPLRARPVSPVEVQIHLDATRSPGHDRPRESTAA